MTLRSVWSDDDRGAQRAAGEQARPERVIVIGAGVAGLASALVLAEQGREVVLLERDEAPPEIDPAHAFESWKRPGVPQFRMSHSLVARLQTILRTHYPALLQSLVSAGITPCPIELVLPTTQIGSYQPLPADIDLRHLLARRATFEYVLHQHVKRLPRVRFVHGARVESLQFAAQSDRVCVTGVDVSCGAERQLIEADIVIDASGATTRTVDWLRARGATIEIDEQSSDFTYFCRHYRLLDGDSLPVRRTGAVLDYLWFGAFYAERGHYSLALACPTAETQLVDALRSTDTFDSLVRLLPGVAELIDRSQVTSKVLGAGGLTNRWTDFAVKDKPELLGFFAVGDSVMHTNPMYGRGCAAAFIQAHALRDALSESRDPVARARSYAAGLATHLRPHFDFCVAADRLFCARGQRARGLPMPRALRNADYFTDHVWAPAVLESPFVARESVKTLQMQEMSGFGRRLVALSCMLLLWMRRGFRSAAPVPERLGPARHELLQALERESASNSAAE